MIQLLLQSVDPTPIPTDRYMPSSGDRIPEEAAREIWRRAAQLQAQAERRLEERARQLPLAAPGETPEGDGLHLDEVRIAAEEAGIAPEFIQIALAEAAAAPGPAAPESRSDVLGARFFLGSSEHTIELSTVVPGSLDAVSAASLQVFSGHPCLLQAGGVAEIPTSSGRVIVFNVPPYDWAASANPPFVEKASMIGLRQLHVGIRPLPEDPFRCEVALTADLRVGIRSRWRWSAATSAFAGAAGGAVGVGLVGSAMAGALIALPAAVGVATCSAVVAATWVTWYRYYRGQVQKSLQQSLQLLSVAARAIATTQGRRDPHPPELPPR